MTTIDSDLVKKNELTRILDAYLARTLAISTEIRNSSADLIDNANIFDLPTVLSLGDLTLIDPPLSQDEWVDFCRAIGTDLDNTISEGLGIHPTVREIFAKCNAICGDKHRLTFDNNDEDANNMLKRPDICVVAKVAMGDTIESVVVPIEIKKFHDLNSAIHQAMGYLVSKLRNLLDLYGFDVKLSGFCMGTDGLHLSVGYACIEDFHLTVASTGKDPMPLWSESVVADNPDTHIREETMGVRAIRTLLSYTAAELGHGAFPRVSLTVDSNTYTLLSVLGRGAFCTAFLGTVKRDGNAETLVTIKRAGLVNNNKHSVALTQLQAECDIIRTFSERASACEKLPKLYDVLWNVSPAAPFIPILPVGVPLERRHTELKPGARTVEAGALFSDINAALTAAHALGLCHRDVRPQNVVFNPIGRHYCLIDWGLAAAPGTPLHPHRGGMPFSHDEVVMARVKNEQINTRPEHDVASVRFVAWAFSVGKKLSVPWAGMSTHLITIRNAAVGDAFL